MSLLRDRYDEVRFVWVVLGNIVFVAVLLALEAR